MTCRCFLKILPPDRTSFKHPAVFQTFVTYSCKDFDWLHIKTLIGFTCIVKALHHLPNGSMKATLKCWLIKSHWFLNLLYYQSTFIIRNLWEARLNDCVWEDKQSITNLTVSTPDLLDTQYLVGNMHTCEEKKKLANSLLIPVPFYYWLAIQSDRYERPDSSFTYTNFTMVSWYLCTSFNALHLNQCEARISPTIYCAVA